MTGQTLKADCNLPGLAAWSASIYACGPAGGRLDCRCPGKGAIKCMLQQNIGRQAGMPTVAVWNRCMDTSGDADARNLIRFKGLVGQFQFLCIIHSIFSAAGI